MATLPTNMPQLAGFPGQWSDTIAPVPEGLIVGETPAVATVDMTIAASQTIPAYTPVGLNAGGHLVPAVHDAGTPANAIKPVGITLYDITTPASPVQGIPVLIQGCLNKDMLAWPASFNTDELKLEAFRGAPTPTSIIIRKVWLGATVAQP